MNRFKMMRLLFAALVATSLTGLSGAVQASDTPEPPWLDCPLSDL